MLEWLAVALASFVSIFWLFIAARTLRSKDLPCELQVWKLEESEEIKLSLVIPFRDEEASLSQTLNKILDQTYKNLEIILVNDRSTDRSGKIASEFAAKDDRIKIIEILKLPAGWLGKPHAMQKGWEASNGDFILFMDADSQLGPRAIEAAINYVQVHLVDHLSVAPVPICKSLLERIVYAGMWVLMGLYIQIWKVNTQSAPVGAGVGAFNLVRRSSLESIGGVERLRMEIVDDMGLAHLLRKEGARSCLVYGGELLAIRYQEGIWGLVKGIEKNAFAAADFKWSKLLLTVFVLLAISWPPYLLVMFSTTALGALLGWSGMLAIMLFSYRVRYFPTWWGVLFFPFVCSFMAFAVLRSAILTSLRGGVQWRDTFYSIDELRKGKVYFHQF